MLLPPSIPQRQHVTRETRHTRALQSARLASPGTHPGHPVQEATHTQVSPRSFLPFPETETGTCDSGVTRESSHKRGQAR